MREHLNEKMNDSVQIQPDFPVGSKAIVEKINSVQTDIIIEDFSNRILIFVSQLEGKPGTFLQVTQDKPQFDKFDPQSNTYEIKTLFGLDKEEIQLAARIFAGALPQSIEKPILFSIALKNFERDNLFAIRDMLAKIAN